MKKLRFWIAKVVAPEVWQSAQREAELRAELDYERDLNSVIAANYGRWNDMFNALWFSGNPAAAQVAREFYLSKKWNKCENCGRLHEGKYCPDCRSIFAGTHQQTISGELFPNSVR